MSRACLCVPVRACTRLRLVLSAMFAAGGGSKIFRARALRARARGDLTLIIRSSSMRSPGDEGSDIRCVCCKCRPQIRTQGPKIAKRALLYHLTGPPRASAVLAAEAARATLPKTAKTTENSHFRAPSIPAGRKARKRGTTAGPHSTRAEAGRRCQRRGSGTQVPWGYNKKERGGQRGEKETSTKISTNQQKT